MNSLYVTSYFILLGDWNFTYLCIYCSHKVHHSPRHIFCLSLAKFRYTQTIGTDTATTVVGVVESRVRQ